jgi:type VI protein secretion system component Hcp
MKTNLYRFAIAAAFTLTTLATNAAPIYMDFGDIKGEMKPTAKDSRKDAIQIESWSLGASPSSTGNVVQGNLIGTDATACSTGVFKFAVRGAEAESVKKLCQSRMPLGNVTVDINGVKHRFENATFSSCQSGDGAAPTDQFSLNFGKCTYHRGGVRVAMGDIDGDGATQSNARLIGLSSGPVPVRLDSLKLAADGKSATVGLTKVGTGTLVLSSSSHTEVPQLVLEMANGTKWTFTQVIFEDVIISSATGARSGKPMEAFTMNFAKVEGPATGFTR